MQNINPSFQTNIRYISRGGHLLVKMGVIQCQHLFVEKGSFSESILFLKMGSLSESILKMGVIGESKM